MNERGDLFVCPTGDGGQVRCAFSEIFKFGEKFCELAFPLVLLGDPLIHFLAQSESVLKIGGGDMTCDRASAGGEVSGSGITYAY